MREITTKGVDISVVVDPAVLGAYIVWTSRCPDEFQPWSVYSDRGLHGTSTAYIPTQQKAVENPLSCLALCNE